MAATKAAKALNRRTEFELYLLSLNMSPRNFFKRDRLKTYDEILKENGNQLPYSLEDISHNAKKFLDLGKSPEEVFWMMSQNGKGKDDMAFLLMSALAQTIARHAYQKGM